MLNTRSSHPCQFGVAGAQRGGGVRLLLQKWQIIRILNDQSQLFKTNTMILFTLKISIPLLTYIE